MSGARPAPDWLAQRQIETRCNQVIALTSFAWDSEQETNVFYIKIGGNCQALCDKLLCSVILSVGISGRNLRKTCPRQAISVKMSQILERKL